MVQKHWWKKCGPIGSQTIKVDFDLISKHISRLKKGSIQRCYSVSGSFLCLFLFEYDCPWCLILYVSMLLIFILWFFWLHTVYELTVAGFIIVQEFQVLFLWNISIKSMVFSNCPETLNVKNYIIIVFSSSTMFFFPNAVSNLFIK